MIEVGLELIFGGRRVAADGGAAIQEDQAGEFLYPTMSVGLKATGVVGDEPATIASTSPA